MHLVGRPVEDRIVQEGRGVDPSRLDRWSFIEIAPKSFVWLGEVSLDDGRTWRLEQRMEALRVR